LKGKALLRGGEEEDKNCKRRKEKRRHLNGHGKR